MDCWTVYFDPKDYPGKYAVRRFRIGEVSAKVKPTSDVYVADTLESARAHIPFGLLRFPRYPHDDSVIVECWM
jgi:hypothetical protein